MAVKSSSRAAEPNRQRPFHIRLGSWLRWVHTYLSLFSLLIILFFSATGLTLNHPDWFFSKKPKEIEREGKVPLEWLDAADPSGAKVAKLEIAEYLRKQGARGLGDDFRVDDAECSVAFKAPAYSADIFIDRKTGVYHETIIEEGAMAALNDLHKGRYSGAVWARVIDASAIFLVIISLTGMGLIFFLKKIRLAGLLTAAAGIVIVLLLIRFFVP